MPDWTENYLRISKNVAPKYLTEGRFDFNKVIPMPDVYTAKNADAPYGPQHSGMHDDETVIIYLTDEFSHELDATAEQLAISSVKDWDLAKTIERAKALYASCKSPEAKANLIESGRLRVDAVKRYGAPDWYAWACRNWGTKWNACDTEIVDKGDGTIEIRFDTAWGYPERIVDALAQKETGWSWKFKSADYSGVYVITPDHLYPEPVRHGAKGGRR